MMLFMAGLGTGCVLAGLWLLRPRRHVVVRDVTRAGNPTRKRSWTP